MRWLDEIKAKLRPMLGMQEPRPDEPLDRWLLPHFYENGPWTAAQFAASATVLSAGPKDPAPPGQPLPRLTSDQVTRWLEGAFQRAFLDTRTLGLAGTALAPPDLVITDAGRERLAEVTAGPRGLDWVVHLVARNRLYNAACADWRTAVAAVPDIQVATEAPHPLRPGERGIQVFEAPSDDEARERLQRIEHIVVVMMENRSFDHMLGYLQLWGHEHVDGLLGARPEEWQGVEYGPVHLDDTRLPKVADPCHSRDCVADQLREGFVANFARQRQGVDPAYVMGYYTGDDLPVYDFLARNFCICDAWHSSVPGSTWPNRLFSLAGCTDGDRDGLFGDGKVLFDVPTFVRKLAADPKVWRWYSHDPATLRLADDTFRPHPLEDGKVWNDPYREHFRFFDRRKIHDITREAEDLVVHGGSSFLEDAAAGDLAQVSWIDPNFVDLSVGEPTGADDHPPSDVHAGQKFILDVCRAVMTSERWPDTLLVITYDEHGGFYDHGIPPAAVGRDGTTGVRVPALIVSPHVAAGVVSKTQFEHTTLIRTVLERFGPPGSVDEMPDSVGGANHLGYVLAEHPRGATPSLAGPTARLAAATNRPRAAIRPEEFRPHIAGFPADVAQGAVHLRANGLPAAHP